MDCLAPATWKLQAGDIKTPVSIICIHFLWKGALSDNFKYFMSSFKARFVSLDVMGLFYSVWYLNRAVWLSTWCHFLDISILLSSFEVLWSSRRGCCHVEYILPANWELSIWNIRTAVSIICKLCLWKATLSDNLIYVFFFFWLASAGGTKLKVFAVDERQRRKNYRRFSVKILAIWRPSLFF